jgi:H3 lysine-79-specific histone-lysine N-methyltransferase
VVSPHIHNLRDAQDKSPKYGEFLFPLITRLLHRFKIDSTSRVVDLGSGVGNVVLQVRLQTGARAYGCEVEPARHRVAELFEQDVARRMAKYPEQFADSQASKLRTADAFNDKESRREVQDADFIIYNSLAFTPDLLERLRECVLPNLKPGAALVSSQRVVRGKKTAREKMLKALEVEESKEKSLGIEASWTDKPIEFWIYRRLS